MTKQKLAPWHKISFDAFLSDSLPRLLTQRVPLASYGVESISTYACRVRILLTAAAEELALDLDVPQPDDDGIFEIDGRRYVVLPLASCEQLDQADVRCVGEQLYDSVEQRLGEAPKDLVWDANLAKVWLPIDTWVQTFVQSQQSLSDTNWLDRYTHLRVVCIPDRKEVFDPSHIGRVCPIRTPEGSNIGRIVDMAMGAQIRDRRIVPIDSRPEAALGLAASMVPFLEHSDTNRLLIGTNIMRQWLPPQRFEPALVQTGNEPEDPSFWCGRDLLTAFISRGAETHEDGIVIGESAAKRMDQGGRPLEVGDKISNRHGTKGVITRILPDDQMPCFADGTPVELIFSWIGLHTRLNFGQQREAVMSRIAKAEGKPVTIKPFCAPGAAEIQARLRQAGLAESGMVQLTRGRGGPALKELSLAGWVYWGKTVHLAAAKIHATLDQQRANMQGEMEYLGLRTVRAAELIRETFHTRATTRPGVEQLPVQIASGKPIEQAAPPSPNFAETVRRLAAAGIQAELTGRSLRFRFGGPVPGQVLKLARPMPHPWAGEQELSEVGLLENAPHAQFLMSVPDTRPLAEASDRLRRLQEQKAPASMVERAAEQLRQRLAEYVDGLFPKSPDLVHPKPWEPLSPPMGTDRPWGTNHLGRNVRVTFSGRTVIAAGWNLRIDQIGLAEEIAWTIFGPFVDRQLGTGAAASRSKEAAAALDAIMADKWILLNRAPTIMPTSILAFHAVRIPEKVIRLHPLTNMLLNADYDGDQSAVFLPITEAGQKEAAERLSVAGHLRRDPSLLHWLIPSHASLWGLARLSLTKAGLERITQILGTPVAAPSGFITRTTLEEAARVVLQREGPERTLEALNSLVWLGFDLAGQSGVSMSPFFGSKLRLPPSPHGDDPDAWNAYSGQIAAAVAAVSDFDDTDMGPQVLAVRSGARGGIGHLVNLLGSRGTEIGLDGKPFIIRHGWVEGLQPQEVWVRAMHARRAMGEVALSAVREAYGIREATPPAGLGVLARAMRADRPGVVFARAALTAETDPLTDEDSRLFLGLP